MRFCFVFNAPAAEKFTLTLLYSGVTLPMSTASEVIQKLKEAFPTVPVPEVIADDIAIGSEGEQVHRLLSGLKWTEVTVRLLLEYGKNADPYAILSFLSNEAFRYYIPAFLSAAVTSYFETGLGTIVMLHLLPPSDPSLLNSFQLRVSEFTEEQRGAIRLFIEWFIEHHAGDLSAERLYQARQLWSLGPVH